MATEQCWYVISSADKLQKTTAEKQVDKLVHEFRPDMERILEPPKVLCKLGYTQIFKSQQEAQAFLDDVPIEEATTEEKQVFFKPVECNEYKLLVGLKASPVLLPQDYCSKFHPKVDVRDWREGYTETTAFGRHK